MIMDSSSGTRKHIEIYNNKHKTDLCNLFRKAKSYAVGTGWKVSMSVANPLTGTVIHFSNLDNEEFFDTNNEEFRKAEDENKKWYGKDS